MQRNLSSAEKARLMIEDPFLVTHPSDMTAQSRSMDSWPLVLAAVRGDDRQLGALLDAHPELVNEEFFYCAPIVFAAKEGHAKSVRLLLDRGANPASVAWWGEETVLKMAEDRGHTDVVEVLRTALAEERGFADGVDLVIDAITDGDHGRLRQLISETPERAAQSNRGGLSPLHKAVEIADPVSIELLLDGGADINRPDGRFRMRPIDYAIWTDSYRSIDNWAIVDLLHSRGAEITIEIAAARGNLQAVQQAVAQDPASVNYESPMGMTPKAAAAQHGNLELLQYLLDHGADASRLEGPWGYALWVAVYNDSYDIAELLCSNGANPNAYGLESSGTPAWVAAWEGKPAGRNQRMIDLLTRYGGEDHSLTKAESLRKRYAANPEDPRLAEEYVWTASDPELLKELLRLKVPMAKSITLCQSYLWRNIETFRTLLENGLDPNLPNYLRMTPLHALAASRHNLTLANPLRDEEGSRAKAKLALEHGADINAIELYHDATPLGWAAKFGSLTMARFFLDEGADPQMAGAPWARPLAMAERGGYADIVDLLRSHT